MRLLLLRHAAHDLAGRALAGRMAGLGLNEAGRAQAQGLARALRGGARIDVLCSSPQQRTQETAAPIGDALGLAVQVAPEFDEIDFGDWTGLPFEEVRARDAARWQQWVDHRSRACAPGGEAFAQVARRVQSGMERLHGEYPQGTVLVVSHADVIKAAVALHLGLSLDLLERFEVGCGTVSVLEMGQGWSKVVRVGCPF